MVVKFSVGDRVFLKGSSGFVATPSNPKKGTRHFCEGAVFDVQQMGDGIQEVRVRWDNGERNVYDNKSIDIVNDKEEIVADPIKLRYPIKCRDKILVGGGTIMYPHGDYFQNRGGEIFIKDDLLKSLI